MNACPATLSAPRLSQLAGLLACLLLWVAPQLVLAQQAGEGVHQPAAAEPIASPEPMAAAPVQAWTRRAGGSTP